MSPSRVVLLGLFAALAACDGGGGAKGRSDGGRSDAGAVADAGTVADAGQAAVDTPRALPDGAPADAEPPHETGTFELPRVPADPKLTRFLVPGEARLVGGDRGSCSHAPPGPGAAAGATPERWCVFSRPAPGATAGAATELWVINVGKALLGPAPRCDGSSPDCVRLTADLWTGTAIYGDSHPSAHRFEGDTLIFHAGAGPGAHDPYQGPIWAWRAGWPAARRLTSDRGLLCHGEHESAAVYCLDAAAIDVDPNNPFNGPKLHAFDLRAGTLDVAPPDGPLPLVGHIQEPTGAQTGALVWRARFTKDGATLLYSTVPAPGLPETLFSIKTAEIGKTVPQMILADIAQWEIAHDGQKIYFLRGYDRGRGDLATGALTMADFPGGANPVALQLSILGFELLGSHDEVFSAVDRGLLLTYAGAKGRPAWAILRDRNRPDDLHLLGSNAEIAQVANDGRHTLTFQELRGSDFPVAFVNRSDGSGSCQLTSDFRAETYGGHFSDDSRRVFWIEYGRYQSESEEGWYARPETCGDKVKFGDFVGWYIALGDDFVLFDGGDLADSTRWLQVTSLRPAPAEMPNLPEVIQEKPDGIVGVITSGGSAWAIYAVPDTQAKPDAGPGLYLHGAFGH